MSENKIVSLTKNQYRFQVFRGKNLIAVTTIYYNPKYITFSLVETDKKYRGRGIGKKMLLDCIAFVERKWPNKNIILEASPYHLSPEMDLSGLIKFYNSVGFEVTKMKKDSALMCLTLKK